MMIKLKSQNGLTLMELILTIAIIGIVSAFIGGILYYEITTYEMVSARKENLQNARFAIQVMTREIRHIVEPDSIYRAAVDSLWFRELSGDVILYHQNGGQLRRNSELLLGGATDFGFTYYDNDGNLMTFPISDPSKIRRISFNLTSHVRGERFANYVTITPRNF